MKNPLRNLPSVGQMLENPLVKRLVEGTSHSVVADGVREVLGKIREQVGQRVEDFALPSVDELAQHVASWLQKSEKHKLAPVVNATGVILHTGLGRAPLSEAAIQRVAEVSAGYSNLEFDLEQGERGQRVRSVARLLQKLTGAEAAAVVNNNAAATMLALNAVSNAHPDRREIIVSRGQLVEIGGSYRLPEVMACSGCQLKEVGTTNKTRVGDYRAAAGPQTAALLKVHPSNFAVVGFTESVALPELVSVGREHGIPVIDDIGSGALFSLAEYGLANEPTVTQSVSAGADLVLFSGDKLLGGPQCGLIVGRAKWIEKVMANPLMRAMRVGKMTLAALEATLECYLDASRAELSIPVLQMLANSVSNLNLRAEQIVGQLPARTKIRVAVEAGQSCLGGGSLPMEKIETRCIAINVNPSHAAELTVESLQKKLRNGTVPVVARIHKDRLLLDLRTILPTQDRIVVQALLAALDMPGDESRPSPGDTAAANSPTDAEPAQAANQAETE